MQGRSAVLIELWTQIHTSLPDMKFQLSPFEKAKEMEPVETQIVEIMPPDIENLIYVVRNKQTSHGG